MRDYRQYEKNTQSLLTGKPFTGLWYASLKKALSDARLQGINYFCIDEYGRCALLTSSDDAIEYVSIYCTTKAVIYDLKIWDAKSVVHDLKNRTI